mgnify:CR=1 FL=1
MCLLMHLHDLSSRGMDRWLKVNELLIAIMPCSLSLPRSCTRWYVTNVLSALNNRSEFTSRRCSLINVLGSAARNEESRFPSTILVIKLRVLCQKHVVLALYYILPLSHNRLNFGHLEWFARMLGCIWNCSSFVHSRVSLLIKCQLFNIFEASVV